MQADLLQSGRQILKANGWDQASEWADYDGADGRNRQIGDGSNGNATGQRGILNVNHVETFLVNESRYEERGYRWANQWQVGVDDGSCLALVEGHGRVEWWLSN